MIGSTRPLFYFDPGWLYVIAGVALCAAGVIVPAQNDLVDLQIQQDQLHAEELAAYSKLNAYSEFLDSLDDPDDSFVIRLAASQLNMIPADDVPIVRTSVHGPPVIGWIDSSIEFQPYVDHRPRSSILSQIADGPHRLWLFGGGVMCIFIGLMIHPSLRIHNQPLSA